MHIKITWKFSGKLLLALLAGGLAGAWLGENIGTSVGLILCGAVVYMESQKPA